jgi:hypothetical protein
MIWECDAVDSKNELTARVRDSERDDDDMDTLVETPRSRWYR